MSREKDNQAIIARIKGVPAKEDDGTLPGNPHEIEPHAYVPSMMHMGDCAVCGHLQGAPIHSPFRR